MSPTLFPAYAAAILGVLMAFVLTVPFAAIQYRRRGGLTVGIALLGFLVLLYIVALISYTLLPLPERVSNFCDIYNAAPQLQPGRFVSDILREAAVRGGGPTSYLNNPALLQIVFNIALFVPLGMVVRYFTKRTILVTSVIGLGTSMLIETTQITGVFFLYPCAYRLFDVDDLFANTSGALLGALLAPVLRLMPGQTDMNPSTPRPVTTLRRLLGMLCDWLIISLGSAVLVFAYLVAVPDRSDLEPSLDSFLSQAAGPLILAGAQLALILSTGRTIGETVVRLRPAQQTRPATRLVRWAAGIGGYAVLSIFQNTIITGILALCVTLSIILAITTRDHRGATYLITRWNIQDDRATRHNVTMTAQARDTRSRSKPPVQPL